MVGVDNHQVVLLITSQVVADGLDPPFSTVDLPHHAMGYWAVGKLVSLIEGEAPDPFPRAGYPVEKVQPPPLSEQSPQLECQLRIKQSWVRPRSQR